MQPLSKISFSPLHCQVVISRPVMYQLLRKILFFFPAEGVHYFAMNSLRLANRSGFRKLLSNQFSAKQKQPVQAFGLSFPNPVGLGAGFDKNALYLNELEALGFGFVEVGTVTPLAQPGNDKPRLFRLPADKALINRMGFNNDGVKVIADRLRQWRARGERGVAGGDKTMPSSHLPSPTSHSLIIGGNIGKNKITANEEAWKDYDICFRELFDCVDYFVVNVSSPNTPGLRELQEKDALQKILSHLQTVNRQLSQQSGISSKPLLLKIAPDLSFGQIDDVIDLALEIKLDGLVATNTTISREALRTPADTIRHIGAGGLSGAPLRERSTEIVRYITKKSGGKIPVIASGGIFTSADAKEKLDAGATLVQVWTGFIYEGPSIVKNIVQGL